MIKSIKIILSIITALSFLAFSGCSLLGRASSPDNSAPQIQLPQKPSDDGNESGGNESGGNESGGNESGGNDSGSNESGGNESGGSEVTPPAANSGITIDGKNVTFWENDYDIVTPSADSMTVTYSDIGKTYTNIGAEVSDLSAGHNMLTLTVVNNTSARAGIRFDLNKDDANVISSISVQGSSEHEINGGGEVVLYLAGNASETVTLKYNGSPSMLIIFIDSFLTDGLKHSGSLTFSAMTFGDCVDAPPAGGGTGPAVGTDGAVDESYRILGFSGADNQGFYAANGYTNGDMFNCYWSNTCVSIADGIMNLTVKKDTDKKNPTGYLGAEYRTDSKRGYGYYEVCMKPAKGSGLVSSFFTYTNDPRWDEIDIEFLGKDTTKVQFNYYTNGTGGHEYLYDLGFDAAAEYHVYAFDWQPDYITWYVDGKPVYTARVNLPEYEQQIMMNIWNCTGHDEWTGVLDSAALPATASYKWVAYVPNAA